MEALSLSIRVENPKLKDFGLPHFATPDAAGMDLRAVAADGGQTAWELAPGQRRLFKTGFSIAIPRGLYGRIAPRSGLAYKQGLDVMAGVVDADYRGEVGVILVNLGQEPVTIAQGDRVAQMIIETAHYATLSEVEVLPDTARGAGGFGSTGTAG